MPNARLRREQTPVVATSDDDDTESSSVISVQEVEEMEDEEAISVSPTESSLSGTTTSWTGLNKKTPLYVFRPDAGVCNLVEHKSFAEKYHLSFKLSKNECRLVRLLLKGHGFREVDAVQSDYNILWSGSHVRPHFLSTMNSFQKVNHFPRSYEITRKDRLYKNIQLMQNLKGFRNFDFVPQTFLLPKEYQDFTVAAYKEKGLWIVKPAASSRGRGIFLAATPEQALVENNAVICRYINNPFLINGFKFDVRLYVAVTSFDPLLVYLYEEGLTRFATVPFDKSAKTINETCMHLTNYSVNRRSSAYVGNNDSEEESEGSKWTLSALLRYLKEQNYDTAAVMMSIEDVIVKTILAGENSISAACKAFVSHRGNCFELFGFDILLDENLRPWVLEVNLSPSLACDAPLDLKVKSNMIADLLNLVGLECQDPMVRKNNNRTTVRGVVKLQTKNKKSLWYKKQIALAQKKHILTLNLMRQCSIDHMKFAAGSNHNDVEGIIEPKEAPITTANNKPPTPEELRILNRVKAEHSRRGGWVRLFPTEDTWDTYGQFFLEMKQSNVLLHKHLFPKSTSINQSPVRLTQLHSIHHNQLPVAIKKSAFLERVKQRCEQYHKSLPSLTSRSPLSSLSNGNTSFNPLARRLKQSSAVKLNDSTAVRSSSSTTVPSSNLYGRRGRDKETSPREIPDRDVSCLVASKDAERKISTVKLVKNLIGRKEANLSICQSKKLFSTYLEQLKKQLIASNSCDSINSLSGNSCPELLKSTIQFLKKATKLLKAAVPFTEPNAWLSSRERALSVAKQLHEFICCFNEDAKQTEQSHGSNNSTKYFDEDIINRFTKQASELDLEKVLDIHVTHLRELSKEEKLFGGPRVGSSTQRPGTRSASCFILGNFDVFMPSNVGSRTTNSVSSSVVTGTSSCPGVNEPHQSAPQSLKHLPLVSSSFASAVNIYGSRSPVTVGRPCSSGGGDKTLLTRNWIDKHAYTGGGINKSFNRLKSRINSAQTTPNAHPLTLENTSKIPYSKSEIAFKNSEGQPADRTKQRVRPTTATCNRREFSPPTMMKVKVRTSETAVGKSELRLKSAMKSSGTSLIEKSNSEKEVQIGRRSCYRLDNDNCSKNSKSSPHQSTPPVSEKYSEPPSDQLKQQNSGVDNESEIVLRYGKNVFHFCHNEDNKESSDKGASDYGIPCSDDDAFPIDDSNNSNIFNKSANSTESYRSKDLGQLTTLKQSMLAEDFNLGDDLSSGKGKPSQNRVRQSKDKKMYSQDFIRHEGEGEVFSNREKKISCLPNGESEVESSKMIYLPVPPQCPKTFATRISHMRERFLKL